MQSLSLQSVGEEVVMEVAYIADLVSDNSDDRRRTESSTAATTTIVNEGFIRASTEQGWTV